MKKSPNGGGGVGFSSPRRIFRVKWRLTCYISFIVFFVIYSPPLDSGFLLWEPSWEIDFLTTLKHNVYFFYIFPIDMKTIITSTSFICKWQICRVAKNFSHEYCILLINLSLTNFTKFQETFIFISFELHFKLEQTSRFSVRSEFSWIYRG